MAASPTPPPGRLDVRAGGRAGGVGVGMGGVGGGVLDGGGRMRRPPWRRVVHGQMRSDPSRSAQRAQPGAVSIRFVPPPLLASPAGAPGDRPTWNGVMTRRRAGPGPPSIQPGTLLGKKRDQPGREGAPSAVRPPSRLQFVGWARTAARDHR
ncbi:hypothetical protein Purlil1_5122 [Purpureocillium lilacinum]|uniref:Uncharacterized protein n=1 Tax=Purpureocillium lilacinum TaxID=33203 RepID=A0ABR0C2L1_PURLI|nr:hypothetical protein Purlil1_5122 [Purpureocillium lilacinum]